MSNQVTPPDAATEDTDTVADQKPDDTEADDQGDKPSDDSAEKLAAAEARADKYARDLFTARVAATGRLADPTDLPFSAELLDDADALTAAIDALTEAKPHLASRKPAWGDVGAGQTKPSGSGPTWANLFGTG